MNPVLQGMALGYSADQILGFLSKTIPSLIPKINKAKKSGYSIEKILDFVSKTMDSETYPENMTPNEIQGAKSRQKDQFTKGLLQTGASIAGTAAAGLALKHALPQAIGQLGLGPAQGQTSSPGTPPNSMAQQPGALVQGAQQTTPNIPGTAQVSPQQPPVSQPNIAQTQQPIQPEVKTIDIGSLLDKSGLKKHVDELSKRIKDPKQIAGVLYSKYPKEMKDFQAQAGKNMEDAIGDYLGQSKLSPTEELTEKTTAQEQKVPDLGSMGKGITDNLYQGLLDALKQGKDTFAGIKDPALAKAKPAFDQGLIKSPKDLQEFLNKPAKIEKSSIVASPNGVGTVKEIRNGNALIDVDGKLHKVKEEELIQSPLPEKELADLYNDVISGIEKESGQEVSRNVYWAGYDPNTNELAYLPHDGGLYIYDDISPEDAKELTNILNKRISTGQNYIGAWTKESSSPIGAQMYQLIKRLQQERGGKGNEYSNKFQKVYDALELAKTAAKKQYEERKKKAKKPRTN